MQKVFASDLVILTKLAVKTPMPVVVLDPKGRLINDQPEMVHPVREWHEIANLPALKTTPHWCLATLSNSGQLPENVTASCVLELNHHNRFTGLQSTRLSFITNPDSSIRWLFPPETSCPWFLSFYHAATTKARWYKAIVKLLFAYRLNNVVRNGFVCFHTNDTLHIEQLVNAGSRRNYAVFTGTTGVNRKIVVADAAEGCISRFIKIALNTTSVANLHNECAASKALQVLQIPDLVFPEAKMLDHDVLALENIAPAKQTDPKKWTVRFLAHLYEKTSRRQPLAQLKSIAATDRRLSRCAQMEHYDNLLPEAAHLTQRLQQLSAQLRATDLEVPVSATHGDFTPWNMYGTDGALHLFDWELSQPDMPLLHDWFHYIIQSEILVKRTPPEQILAVVQQQLQQPEVQELCRLFEIDPDLHLRLYLLNNTSYYLDLYLRQPRLHAQVYWLLEAWHVLLLQTCTLDQSSNREAFIPIFFNFLADKKYVLLKSGGKSAQSWPENSDIDLLIEPAHTETIINWVNANTTIRNVKIIRQPAATALLLFFYDGSFLSIDLLTAFHRKGIQYLDASLLLNNHTWQDGAKVPLPAFDYLYTWLFYQLNGAGIPPKYAEIMAQLSPEVQSQCLRQLSQCTGCWFPDIASSFAYWGHHRQTAFQTINAQPANRLFARLKRTVGYALHTASAMFRQQGFMVSFSGVDGAGKTTVLTATRQLIETRYRKKVVVLRHRPSVLPILSAWKYGKQMAEQRSLSSLPRTGGNQSAWSSLFRFGYYFTDYFLGQWLVYAKYIMRGYVVLYDRYYFDFIVDGKRSNLLNMDFLAKKLLFFIQKPALNFFLFASPEVILQRKKELSAADITALTAQYRDLFESFEQPSRYTIINNLNQQDTLRQIESALALQLAQ